MDAPSNLYQGYLPPRAPPTSSVSTSLDHAGGTSAGRSKKNSIAFGTLPLWTSTTVNEGPICRPAVERAQQPDRHRIIGYRNQVGFWVKADFASGSAAKDRSRLTHRRLQAPESRKRGNIP